MGNGAVGKSSMIQVMLRSMMMMIVMVMVVMMMNLAKYDFGQEYCSTCKYSASDAVTVLLLKR